MSPSGEYTYTYTILMRVYTACISKDIDCRSYYTLGPLKFCSRLLMSRHIKLPEYIHVPSVYIIPTNLQSANFDHRYIASKLIWSSNFQQQKLILPPRDRIEQLDKSLRFSVYTNNDFNSLKIFRMETFGRLITKKNVQCSGVGNFPRKPPEDDIIEQSVRVRDAVRNLEREIPRIFAFPARVQRCARGGGPQKTRVASQRDQEKERELLEEKTRVSRDGISRLLIRTLPI